MATFEGMAIKHRPEAEVQRDAGHGRASSPHATKDAAQLGAKEQVIAVPADRVATADEVRAVGERAAARWGSLLKRLAE